MKGKWTQKKLDDACIFYSGSGFPERFQGIKNGDYPFVKVSDMNIATNKRLIIDANNWVSHEIAIILGAKIIPPHATVFAKLGAALLLNRRRLTIQDTCLDNNMMAAIVKDIDYKYLYYLFLTIDFSYFSQIGALPSINTEALKNHLIFIPKEENCQKYIADILSTCDEVIEKTEDALAKYRAIKNGMLQDLFSRGLDANGKLRPTPQDAPELYKDSPLGLIPKEWEVKNIGEMFEFKNGLNKGKEFFGYGTPIVNYTDVYSNTKITPKILKGRVCLSEQEIKMFEVQKGDVFFTRTSETPEEVGYSTVMVEQPQNTVFSGFILRARPTGNDLLDGYKQYCFRTNSLRKLIVSDCTYTTRALTNGTKLSKLNMTVPSHDEQKRIAARLSAMDEQIAAEERTLEKYRAIKQGLMKKLLTPPEGALEA